MLAKQTGNELALKQLAIDLAIDLALAGEQKAAAQVKLGRAKTAGDRLNLLLAFQQTELARASQEAPGDCV